MKFIQRVPNQKATMVIFKTTITKRTPRQWHHLCSFGMIISRWTTFIKKARWILIFRRNKDEEEGKVILCFILGNKAKRNKWTCNIQQAEKIVFKLIFLLNKNNFQWGFYVYNQNVHKGTLVEISSTLYLL